MKLSEIQGLMALALCEELADYLERWTDAYGEEEPGIAPSSYKLIERTRRLLSSIESEHENELVDMP